ncbi:MULTISPECIES: asparagine synthase (glutamine-hydrolyzing) [Streptomycetaceae]|uniref:asparagine synthase (glutamine-hydrolyzing) n=1 Tax=Streptantibioticus cattleyicolor (strain ATCC 35852 / DSM 46488 / JCM 4925 / NBRC 14057 / NRRL 8057) TaxID=1003195 RepID=F8JRE2_STREN|nr:asparagine synthase (glutamine-hydrolyzing) [Streptantibioticus cattleyicolor]AEW96641.1 putative amidotransferase [Streptantibioticus cattleyicolor NRRL 8057 = DSM 46488]MYS61135.1 asparagine synthase (glutamine-hydrolyzing) [Streptomyces sp. SID5468]CCB76980.1 Asparagine synthetase [glutamine-hydrolyzing] 3 [Streptantibioticus cattleyicolor NRRL 8057 = DSM 46488]
MCGITGWVDFTRDLTRERHTTRAMTDTMACRGPDDEGCWSARHVALGHRRLAVIDVAGGRQPMRTPETGPDGEPVAVISYSGEVYNFRELREELVLHGHHFRTRSDTEVVLRAYLEWGSGFVGRLGGMYAFALWDNRTEELLLVRDRLGVKPLFHHPLDDGVLFGSEPKAILANPLATPRLDLDGLRDALALARVPGRTPLTGVYEVKPGHLVRVRRGRLTEERYWSLRTRPHHDDLDTTIATVRDLLTDTVDRQLVSDVPLCALLSGGLDSSALTAMAQRSLTAGRAGDAAGEVIRTFSVDFAGYTENFTPEPFRETPDAPYVAELVRHVGTDHHEILLDTAQLVDPAVRRRVLRAWDLPYGIGDHDPSLLLLFEAVRRRSTVALSGESADEVFGGYLWFHHPDAVRADTFPWHAVNATPVAEQATAFLDPALVKELALAEYVADTYREAVAEVEHLPGDDATERRMRVASHLNITRFLPMLLDRKDRMSMAVGLEVRVPFCDHRLVSYVYNAPWAMKTFDGREKSLLRAATEQWLPPSIVRRRKAPYPSTQDTGYDLAVNRELARIAADPASPAAPLLDRAALRAFLDRPLTGPYSMMQRSVHTETPVRLDAWLGEYGVRLDGLTG